MYTVELKNSKQSKKTWVSTLKLFLKRANSMLSNYCLSVLKQFCDKILSILQFQKTWKHGE